MVKRRFNFLAGQMAVLCLIAFGMSTALLAQGSQSASSTDTGQISGLISFQGKKPVLHPISMANAPVCASLHSGPIMPKDGEVNSDGSLPNAFVYIVSADGVKLPSTPPRNPVIITQKGCEYLPHVVGVMAGQPFEVVNLDPVSHNIHVMAKNNPQWNVTQLPGSASVVRKFANTEIMIPVRCNIHPWMLAYVGVVNNPFYTVTGNDGMYTIKDLPPGRYTLAVWTATFGTTTRQITVQAGETTTADFVLSGH